MKHLQTIIVGFVCVVALLVGAGVWFFRVIDSRTPNKLVSELVSPDTRLKAVVFERSGGATTGFSTQVSIVESSQPRPTGAGNVFIADTDHGKAPAAAWGGPEVKLYWQGPRNLVIEHHKWSRVFKSERSKDGVVVEYKQFN